MSLVKVSPGEKSELVITDPGANQSVIRGALLDKLFRRSVKLGDDGNGVAALAIFFGSVGFPILLFTLGIEIAAIEGLTALSITAAGFLAIYRGNKDHRILREQYLSQEYGNVKRLLYEAFGHDAGITKKVVSESALNNYTWKHGVYKYTVAYDLETSTYSFERKIKDSCRNVIPQESILATKNLLLGDLPVGLTSPESEDLLDDIERLIAPLAHAPLSVESSHEVKRLTLDTKKLITMSSELALYDADTASSKLVKGLQQLKVDGQKLADLQKDVLVQQIDSHQNYMESRSLEGVS